MRRSSAIRPEKLGRRQRLATRLARCVHQCVDGDPTVRHGRWCSVERSKTHACGNSSNWTVAPVTLALSLVLAGGAGGAEHSVDGQPLSPCLREEPAGPQSIGGAWV